MLQKIPYKRLNSVLPGPWLRLPTPLIELATFANIFFILLLLLSLSSALGCY